MEYYVFVTFYTISYIELAITSRENITEENLTPRFGKNILSSYCDTEYFVANITAHNADDQCSTRCSSLRGYITDENELVCYKRMSKAVRISKRNEKCTCGHKTDEKTNDRQRCFPPLEYNSIRYQSDCDNACSKHTVLRSNKFNEKVFRVMWCGGALNPDKVIENLNFDVKVVARGRGKISSVICYCGSGDIKAKTFISEDTLLKRSAREISRNTDGRGSIELAATCSFGKFFIKRHRNQRKCQSICIFKKAFFIPDSRELICYDHTTDAARIPSIKKDEDSEIVDDNICECGVKFGRSLKKYTQSCVPVLLKENTMKVKKATFIWQCRRICSDYRAYVAVVTRKSLVVFCEGYKYSARKIFAKLDSKLGNDITTEDNEELTECECGLTEQSLFEYEKEIKNEIESPSSPTIKGNENELLPLLPGNETFSIINIPNNEPMHVEHIDCRPTRMCENGIALDGISEISSISSPLLSSSSSHRTKRKFDKIIPEDCQAPSPTCHHETGFKESQRGELLPDFDAFSTDEFIKLLETSIPSPNRDVLKEFDEFPLDMFN